MVTPKLYTKKSGLAPLLFHVSGHAGINLRLKLLLCKMDIPLKNFKEQRQGGTNKPRGTLLSSRPRLSTTSARGSGSGTKLLYLLLRRQSLQQVTLQVSHPCACQGFFLRMCTRFTISHRAVPIHAHSHQGFYRCPESMQR